MFQKNVTKVVQDCILDSGIQAKVVAEKINKLGAETLLEIMKVTHDIRPLQYMASEMGYALDGANA
jgi:ABC-type dipeptide/oligopeptide/nickel transport system ATPase subunit